MRLAHVALALMVLSFLAVTHVAQEEQPKPDDKKAEAPAQSYRLRWNFTEGDKLSYRQVQTVKQDMFGMDVLNVNTTDYTVTCLGFTDEGSVRLEWRYDRIAMKIETTGINVDYDSAKPDPDELEKLPETKGVAALVGKTFSYEITLDFKIENLKGWDKVREQVLKEFHGEMRKALEPTYSDETRINQLEAALRTLPTEKVKVGDEWTTSFVEPAGEVGLLTHALTIKLESVSEENEEQLATISYTSDVTFDKFKDGPYAAMNVSLREGEGSGTDIIDMKAGAIRKQTSKQKISMDYAMAPGAPVTHVIEIEMTVELLPEKKTEATKDDEPEKAGEEVNPD